MTGILVGGWRPSGEGVCTAANGGLGGRSQVHFVFVNGRWWPPRSESSGYWEFCKEVGDHIPGN